MPAIELTAVELAAGVVFGADRNPPALEGEGSGETARAALERAVEAALRRPPCLVSFSGGRDSSAVLAVATAVARRSGLPDPVPATNRFTGAPAADEAEWQERVVAHLRLDDWLRLEWDGELDVVGPVAARVMARHGLMWPFNAHFHVPLLEAARGGSLLTGVGGDELFGCSFPSRLADLMALRVGPEPRDLARIGLAAAPPRIRRAVQTRRMSLDLPWLTPRGRRAVVAVAVEGRARQPHRVLSRMRWFRTLRYLEAGMDSLSVLAHDAGAVVAHPLAERRVWAAVAREAGAAGFADRTTGMRRLFSGLLPDEVLARRGKAGFDEVFFGGHARDFATGWDGVGLPLELVDTEQLREHWRGPSPLAQSFLLVQAAWLAAHGSGGRGVEESLGGAGQRVPAQRAA